LLIEAAAGGDVGVATVQIERALFLQGARSAAVMDRWFRGLIECDRAALHDQAERC
jgi:hypothetical protein